MNAKELKRRRLAINLTQAELAKALGVTVTAIGMWERGERTPATPQMLNLALCQIEMEACAPDDLLRRCREAAERGEARLQETLNAERQRVRKSA